jgi:hypothetical protein
VGVRDSRVEEVVVEGYQYYQLACLRQQCTSQMDLEKEVLAKTKQKKLVKTNPS